MAVDRSYVGAAVLALLAWCCGIVAVSYCFVSLVSLTLLDRLSHKLYNCSSHVESYYTVGPAS